MSVRNIAEDLSFTATRDPGKVAVIDGDRELSYGELNRLADGFAERASRTGRSDVATGS